MTSITFCTFGISNIPSVRTNIPVILLHISKNDINFKGPQNSAILLFAMKPYIGKLKPYLNRALYKNTYF